METFGEAERSRLMPSVMCVRTAIYFFFPFPFFFFFRCESLWAPCHQLQMFSPTKLLTSICGQEETEERGEIGEREGGKSNKWDSLEVGECGGGKKEERR